MTTNSLPASATTSAPPLSVVIFPTNMVAASVLRSLASITARGIFFCGLPTELGCDLLGPCIPRKLFRLLNTEPLQGSCSRARIYGLRRIRHAKSCQKQHTKKLAPRAGHRDKNHRHHGLAPRPEPPAGVVRCRARRGLPGGTLEDCNRLPHAQAESCHRYLYE